MTSVYPTLLPYALTSSYHCHQVRAMLRNLQAENRQTIVESNGIKPLVGLTALRELETSEGEAGPELAAILMVRLVRSNPDVAAIVAEKAGIVPLVKLAAHGKPGAQQQAASALAELALVTYNRDAIANAGGIVPMIRLLDSCTVGTPEMVRGIC